MMLQNLNRLSVIFVLSLPIIFEVFRKYIFFSSIWLIVLDLIFLVIFVSTLMNFKPPTILNIWLFVIAIFVLHGLAFSIIDMREPYPILFGLRLAFYPIFGFLVASSLTFDKDLTGKLIKVTLILLLLISVFGMLQIIIDQSPWERPTHWINYVPTELNYACCSFGFGGSPFDSAEYKLIPGFNIYRPHSIFLHTGKFGQTVFGLSVILLMLARDLTPKNRGILMIIIILCNLITSQRSALYPLISFMLLYTYLFSENKMKIFIIAFITGLSLSILKFEKISFLVFKFFSIIPEIPSRLELFYAANGLIDNNLLGDGWGLYATGAQAFGGLSFPDVYGGEGGWIIIAGELGIPIAVILCLLALSLGALIFLRSILKTGDSYLAFWASFTILLLPLWAATHNIFGSYIMMFYSFIAVGLYFNKSFNLKIKDKLF